MKTKMVWYSILFFFLIGFIGFVVGFGNALSIGMAVTQQTEPAVGMPAESSSEPGEETGDLTAEGVRVIVLGDSLARGAGDPAGEGFAERVVQAIEARMNEPVNLYNFAVEGMRSEALVSQLEDPMILQAIANARYVMISIGGNDLRDVARLSLIQQDQAFEESLSNHITNLNRILQRLRTVNDQALIVFIGLYNVDYSRRNDPENAYLLEWNYETHQLLETDDHSLFIPTYDLFQLKVDQYLSFDGLHPSAAGYDAIADRIMGNLPD